MSPTPLVAALAAVVLGAAAASGVHAQGGSSAATAVQVVSPERQSIHRRRTLPAGVEPFEAVRLHAKVAGYLADIRVDIGDRVRKGETLAVIEVPEMAAERPVLEAELAEAKAQLGKAEAANQLQRAIYERSRALRARGSITEQDLEQARAEHAAAAAEVALARARIASVRARVQRLETLLAYATITAPFEGVVTERFVHPGALIRVATASSSVAPIITVQRADVVRAITAVPESDVPFVDRGDPATLVVRALPERTFAAAVTRAADALDPATRTMRVEVDVPNPDGALRPGMYGELSLDLDQRPGVLTLPATAVMNDKGQTVVYVVGGGTAHKVAVTTGAEDGGRIEIRAGLDGTEQVVAEGGGALSDGTPVRVVEAGASGGSPASR
jgi:RND family efflux transporter MFP subunit